MKDKNKTPVIFRTFRKGGDVIALFPFIPSDHRGYYCQSYQKVGQHGGADPGITNPQITRPSNRHEVAELRRELVRYGYGLRVLKRIPRNALSVRRRILGK